MVRHIRAEQLEAVARPIVAVGNEYPAGHQHPPHSHRRSQLLFAERGTMLVRTAWGAWMVPPSQGIWIPGGTVHGITMLGQVATRSVYLEADAVDGLARRCQVIGVTPLLRQLLIAAVDLPAEYEPESRAGRIDLLVTDVGLPGMNGRQLAEAARSCRPGLKVLFITGFAASFVNGGSDMAPGMDVMTKPFVMDELAAKIKMMINDNSTMAQPTLAQ